MKISPDEALSALLQVVALAGLIVVLLIRGEVPDWLIGIAAMLLGVRIEQKTKQE